MKVSSINTSINTTWLKTAPANTVGLSEKLFTSTPKTSFSSLSGTEYNNLVDIESDKQLHELLKDSKKPVLINFHAEWCGVCKKQEKVFEMLPEAFKAQFKLASVDITQLPDLAQKYNIYSLPTSLLYKNGAFIQRQEGLINANKLGKWLD